MWEYRATGIRHIDFRKSLLSADSELVLGGPSILLACTRQCGATPSRQQADIVRAAKLCLEHGLREFVLPG